jgi:hypothetical protein
MARGEIIGCFGLTEPHGGSDPGNMKTHAKRDGGDWVINGSKMWITNGSVANIAIVWAMTEEGIQGFLIEKGTPGFAAHNIERKMSLRASITSALFFDDVRVPDSQRLPNVRGLKGPLSCLTQARYGITWGPIGAAIACYREALEYAKTRIIFGKPIAATLLLLLPTLWLAGCKSMSESECKVADWGRERDDPGALILAARMVAEVPVRSDGEARPFFTADALLDEALEMAGDDPAYRAAIDFVRQDPLRGVESSPYGEGPIATVKTLRAREVHGFDVRARPGEILRVAAIGDEVNDIALLEGAGLGPGSWSGVSELYWRYGDSNPGLALFN